MKPEDYIAPPCQCFECERADVTTLPQRRDYHTGAWLHGYPLRRWYTAKAEFEKRARAAVGPRGRHENGFETFGGSR